MPPTEHPEQPKHPEQPERRKQHERTVHFKRKSGPHSLSEALLDRLSRGVSRLSDEASQKISGFILGQRTPEGLFVNKAGVPDLYYHPFALSCAIALNAYPELAPIKRYLSQQKLHELDLVHLASLSRARQALRLLEWKKRLPALRIDKLPFAGQFSRVTTQKERLAFKLLYQRNQPVDFPNLHSASPYSLFIALGLAETTGFRPFDGTKLQELLTPFRVADGGWSNLPQARSASANATAAALCVTRLLGTQPHPQDIEALRALQDHSGGFRASTGSPLPDLLSTATALFALDLCGEAPLFPAKSFIQDHWCNDGGFCGTILEEETDSEYTFYGLLALGSCPTL